MLGNRLPGALCILLLALPGCARDGASEDVARQRAASGVEAFFRYGMVELGPGRDDLADQLGAPDSTAARPIGNTHDAALTDTVVTLHYPGLEAEVYRAGFDGRELLAALHITDERYLQPASPIRLGTSADELQIVLGVPDEVDAGDLVYRCATCSLAGGDVVRLLIDDGLLSAISVQYWLD